MFLYFKRREKRGKREAPRPRFLVLRRKTLTVGAALLAAAAIFGAVNAPAAVRASVATRQLPIYCVERDQKVCSISFDAAWWADNTQKILDVLADYGVKATFFVVGNWADQYPERAKAIVDSGCELMNHSTSLLPCRHPCARLRTGAAHTLLLLAVLREKTEWKCQEMCSRETPKI